MRRAMSHEGSADLQSPVGAALRLLRYPERPRGVVLVLHGGSPISSASLTWWSPAVLRMYPIARAVRCRVPDVSVALLRHAVAGWNGTGTGAAPLTDVDWALDQLRARNPGAPIILLGHSMGGRSAAHRVGANGVAGAVLLTPWLPAEDPVDGVAGRPLVVVQAAWDRTIRTPDTDVWLRRAARAGASVDRELLSGTEHAMLLRFPTWHSRAAAGVRSVLSAAERGLGRG